MTETFWSVAAPWWPYLFIVLAGWAATDPWRYAGVLLAGRLSEDSEVVIWVRSVATALVAGVIAKLVLFPVGMLAEAPLAARLGAVIAGFAVFWWVRRSLFLGIATAEAVLIGGWLLLG